MRVNRKTLDSHSTESLQARDDVWLIDNYVASRDLKYLGILYERYMHLVYGVCFKYLQNRETGQDAVMQIFEKLILELPKQEVRNFKPWLYVMAKNYCLMQLRKEKSLAQQKEKMLENDDIFMEMPVDMHPEVDEDRLNNVDLLRKCIDQLKLEQQECVKLFYLEEECYRDIAELTKLDLKKVKSHIQNGKRNLKICMEKNG